MDASVGMTVKAGVWNDSGDKPLADSGRKCGNDNVFCHCRALTRQSSRVLSLSHLDPTIWKSRNRKDSKN